MTSEADAELECWVYQCLLEAYQLQPATVMPAAQVLEPAIGAAARPTLPSQTMEARAAEATFLLCLLKKPVYPHPSTTASRYCDNPGADTFFFFFCKNIYLHIHKQRIYNQKKEKK